jgi:hypothetical protein
MMIPIGTWALRQACEQAKTWHDAGHHSLSLAVNLSVTQLQQVDLVDRVRTILNDTGFPAGSLELEITESSAMQSPETSIRTLFELKKLGIRISLDDFGTGHSSLSYLKRFPIDTLKIDQPAAEGDRGRRRVSRSGELPPPSRLRSDAGIPDDAARAGIRVSEVRAVAATSDRYFRIARRFCFGGGSGSSIFSTTSIVNVAVVTAPAWSVTTTVITRSPSAENVRRKTWPEREPPGSRVIAHSYS